MGSKNATTTQTTAPNPQAMQSYQDLLGRASSVAQTPYQAYSGDLTAPINAQQQMGIGNINQNAGFAQPYIQQAAGYANDAAQPITAADIQRYSDPFTQQVIQATQNQFQNMNAQQQQGVVGNAASQGALGGDRVGVAQAELAGQQQRAQAPIIAGLQSQGYNTGLQTALNQQQQRAQAAYSLGNLGVAGQNAALTGANAQVGAGSLQQGTEQQRLNALYQQFQMQQAFPYQQAQWLAGINTGVGSQMGGTSTTTGPPPNPWSQLAGLGIAGLGGAGMLGWKPLAASGGRISGFAEGGAPAMPYAGVGSWVPPNQITMGRGAPAPPGSGQPSPGVQKMVNDASAMARAMKQGSSGPYPSQNEYNFMDADADRRAGILPGDVAQGGFGQIYADGGLVNLPTDGRIDLPQGFQGGGMPTMAGFGGSMVPQGYADRGAVRSAAPGKDEQWVGFETNDPNTGEPISGKLDTLPPIYPSQNEYNFMDEDADLRAPRRPLAGFDGMPPEITGGRSKPTQRLPGEYTPGVGANPLAYADEGDDGGSPNGASRPQGGFGGPGLSQALMAAGFGMMASKSPYFGVAAGEGGLSGLNTYAAGQKQALAEKRADATMARQDAQSAIQNKSVELRAKQLMQDAERHAAELAQKTEFQNRPKIEKGMDEFGRPNFHLVDPVKGTIKKLDPTDTEIPISARPTQGSAPSEIAGALYNPPKDSPVNNDVIAKPIDHPVNDEVLAKLDPRMAREVKALAEGRLAPPTGRAASTPYWQERLARAVEYDPQFDAINYGARSAALKDVTSGPTSRIIRPLNTTANHMAEFYEAAKELDGFKSGSFGPATKTANGLRTWWNEHQQDPRIRRFNSAVTAVTEELEKAFKGSNPAVSGIAEWRKSMSPASSPEELNAATRTFVKLLHGQLDSVTDQYRRAFGSTRDALEFLSPQARSTFERLEHVGERPEEKKPAAASKPQTVTQGGHTYTLQPDGSYK